MREIYNIFHLTTSSSSSEEQGEQYKRFERNCGGCLPTTTGTLGEEVQERGETNTEREPEREVVVPLVWLN